MASDITPHGELTRQLKQAVEEAEKADYEGAVLSVQVAWEILNLIITSAQRGAEALAGGEKDAFC